MNNQPVMSLLSGGGYSDYVTAHRDQIIEVNSTENISIAEWAGVPEVWLTALMLMGDMGKGEGKVMVYGGASGVGTSLVQLLKMQLM